MDLKCSVYCNTTGHVISRPLAAKQKMGGLLRINTFGRFWLSNPTGCTGPAQAFALNQVAGCASVAEAFQLSNTGWLAGTPLLINRDHLHSCTPLKIVRGPWEALWPCPRAGAACAMARLGAPSS